MNAVVSVCWSLALIALMGAAFATIVGAASLRDRLFAAAICCMLVALLLPLADTVVGTIFSSCIDVVPAVTAESTATPAFTVPFVLGHAVFAFTLVRRRLRRPEDFRREAGEFEQARGRERPRLPADGEDLES